MVFVMIALMVVTMTLNRLHVILAVLLITVAILMDGIFAMIAIPRNVFSVALMFSYTRFRTLMVFVMIALSADGFDFSGLGFRLVVNGGDASAHFF